MCYNPSKTDSLHNLSESVIYNCFQFDKSIFLSFSYEVFFFQYVNVFNEGYLCIRHLIKGLQATNTCRSKQALVFTSLLYKSLENTVGEGENAHNEQFLLFPKHFLLS